MGLFDSIREPTFIKEDSAARNQLQFLKEIMTKTHSKELQEKLEQDIRQINSGMLGEDTIAYELRNSHMPMIILHDLYLEHKGLTAQIDYLILTRKRHYIIECKNLYGDIEINDRGDFIRNVQWGKIRKKEGIYSPLTQNVRHLELIRQIRADQGGYVFRSLFEKSFNNTYRSIVVLANPKTVLNAKSAAKEVRDQVIRADQLVDYIKRCNAEFSATAISEAEMKELSQFFLKLHKENPVDYCEKYRDHFKAAPLPHAPIEKPAHVEAPRADPPPQTADDPVLCPRCGAPMAKRTATKGAHAGQEFYGCTKFPHCRGVMDITPAPHARTQRTGAAAK